MEIFLQLAANVGMLKPGYKGEMLRLQSIRPTHLLVVIEQTAADIFIDEVSFGKALTLLSTRWRIFTFDELTHLCGTIPQFSLTLPSFLYDNLL